MSESIKEAMEGLCLQKPPLPIATLYRQIVKLARDRGEQAPSYGTVFNIVRSLPADLVTLAHEGTKAYSNEASIRKAQRISRGEIGELAIGYMSALTHDFLGKALEVWRLNSPGMIVDCIEMDSVSQERALLEGASR